ncbi:MAG: ScpA family protein [Hyphomicrobiales bacterium]|nr:ScpA family protein [Hyphomicrobiales bacterium]
MRATALPDAANETWTSDAETRSSSETLVIALDGFEGPLDLLLGLAKSQKLDLSKLSILDLAQQYLAFIAAAKNLRLEIAADYLVMASWLAYLKSKLLLPHDPEPEQGQSGKELAAQLAFRLQRLEAMRDAVASIMGRKQLGVDFFARGMPETIKLIRSSIYHGNVFDLLKAYAEQRKRTAVTSVQWGGREVWSIKQARERLSMLIGASVNWEEIDQYLEEYFGQAELGKTVTASTFGASLELAREGYLEIRQAEAFAPLYLRWRGAERPTALEAHNANQAKDNA